MASIDRRFWLPIAIGLVWLAFALALNQTREALGGVLLVWIPSGVAVAGLHLTRREDWADTLGAITVAELVFCRIIGLPLTTTVAFCVAVPLEALICGQLGYRILGGSNRPTHNLHQIAGLFGASVVGAATSAVLTLPFRFEPSLAEMAWWFLASVLGILIATPIFLALGNALVGGTTRPRRSSRQRRQAVLFVAECTLLMGIAGLVLSIHTVSLSPLLVVGIVAISIRHGQIGAAAGILIYAVAATIISLGGHSPAAFLHVGPAVATLWLQALMLLMVAQSMPLVSMLLTRDRLERGLRERNALLSQNLTILGLSEELAGLGRWRYDLRTGAQDWSPRMLELNGLDPSLAPDPGNVRSIMLDSGRELFDEIASHKSDTRPYTFDYRVKPAHGPERILRMSMINEFDDWGCRSALFGVAMDVTSQIRREEALDLARNRAVELAEEAQRLAHTDTLTGLPNRRHALIELDRLVDRAARDGRPLTVVMFDIDHFKRVNDTHGHQIGDCVLQRVAGLAQSQARSADLVGRIGGEEFVWLIPGIGVRDARVLAERLRSAIESGSGADGLPPVTASIGISGWHEGDNADMLLARADAALYRAKHGGRNQVRRAA